MSKGSKIALIVAGVAVVAVAGVAVAASKMFDFSDIEVGI
jgi:hypothetical protein